MSRRKNKKSKKSTRKVVHEQVWRDLEKLGYAYVCSLQDDSYILKSVLTGKSHDSGYDGIWIIIPDTDKQIQTILMEAKYRSNSDKSLPLNDCAKAVVIAFNMSANKLYIVTNKAFAPQTIKEITQFNHRSRLKVIGVNQTELKSFIQKSRESLINKYKIDEVFLQEMESDSPKNSIPDIDICDNSEKIFFDDSRKDLIGKITAGLCSERVIYMLAGSEGVGKSILSKEVEKELLIHNHDVFRIDLSLCTSSRVLYLKILEAIWGVSLTTILEDDELGKYLDKLINMSKTKIENSVANAIKHILTSGVTYVEHKDVYFYLLLEYINCILTNQIGHMNLAIFFENINMLSEEIADFLLEIIKVLRKNNIKILIEIKTPFTFPNATDMDKSNLYFNELNQCADDCFTIGILEHETAVDMIRQQINMSNRVCGNLAETLGCNPLEIKSALKILPSAGELRNIGLENMTKEELEDYWYKCGISVNTVVPSLIKKLRSDSMLSYAFEMITLLKGSIPYYILNKIDAEKRESFVRGIKGSTIFRENRNAFDCYHLRYLKAMENSSDFLKRYEVAEWLLPIIQENVNANPMNSYIELNLLYALEKDELIPNHTLLVISLLKEDHQYRDAIEVANKYIELIDSKNTNKTKDKKVVIQILLQAISCVKELDEDNNRCYESLYKKVYEYILSDNVDTQNMDKNWYQFQLLVWFKEFKIGHFESALEIAESLYNQIEKVSKLFDESEDYPGQVYNAYGLSLKVKNSGDAAENIFKECVAQYPFSYYGRAALLSQNGNKLLRTDPISAAQSYVELLKTVRGKNYPYQECLHTRIDIAMSNFLAEKYNFAQQNCKECVDIASTIGIYTQKGRALNIWGCCFAAQKDYKKSEEVFRESVNLLELSKAANYSWRAHMNLASILLQQNKSQDAVVEFESVVYMLTELFKDKIMKDQDSVPYQCLLVILLYYFEAQNIKRIKQILIEFSLKILSKDFSRLSKMKNWRETFHSKVVFRGDVILVTG